MYKHDQSGYADKSHKVTGQIETVGTRSESNLPLCRNYMTIDILRRVLEDYFGYDVTFVMNITDVDDKIVLRARRNHLLRKYQEEAKDILQVDFLPPAHELWPI